MSLSSFSSLSSYGSEPDLPSLFRLFGSPSRRTKSPRRSTRRGTSQRVVHKYNSGSRHPPQRSLRPSRNPSHPSSSAVPRSTTTTDLSYRHRSRPTLRNEVRKRNPSFRSSDFSSSQTPSSISPSSMTESWDDGLRRIRDRSPDTSELLSDEGRGMNQKYANAVVSLSMHARLACDF